MAEQPANRRTAEDQSADGEAPSDSIFDKTGASNRLELALLAIRKGVVDG
jgi:hypothetical protein